jgi:hypothetical protein
MSDDLEIARSADWATLVTTVAELLPPEGSPSVAATDAVLVSD